MVIYYKERKINDYVINTMFKLSGNYENVLPTPIDTITSITETILQGMNEGPGKIGRPKRIYINNIE